MNEDFICLMIDHHSHFDDHLYYNCDCSLNKRVTMLFIFQMVVDSTLRLHYVRVHGKKQVIMDHIIHTRSLFKIFNPTSFTGFHIRKQMPHPL